jgi:hypothetical protein
MNYGRARLLAVALCAASGASRADAPPPAPALAMQAAHRTATLALAAVVQKLPAADRQRIVGAYVAFQADARDPVALAACDDDGDYVVVMSDAMLRLADFVAQAQTTDASTGAHAVDAYASLLAREQRVGERLLPPPPGAFEPARGAQASTPPTDELQSKRFRAIVLYLVAAEVAHALAGDVTCPHPTATHERGDDVWTSQEHAAALRIAMASHTPRSVVTADAVGTGLALTAGEREDALAAFLAPFLAAVEPSPSARDAFTYLRLHAGSAVRAQVVRTAAADVRAKHPEKADTP